MENEDVKERRKYERVALDLEMEVSLLSDPGSDASLSSHQCKGRDISGGGVSFFANSQFQPESLLRLRIAFEPQQVPVDASSEKLLKVMGKVMWSRKNSGSDNYITGVEFLNIYDDDFHYLLEYVNQKASS
jgi:c-di-GMP-binding flagellar brake protein YcgR